MINKKINHVFEDNIVCPYCGYEVEDSWDIDLEDGNEEELECGDCGKVFNCEKNVRVSYTTYRPEEDCMHEGQEDETFCEYCDKYLKEK
jgi:transcription elongation factor Elf1